MKLLGTKIMGTKLYTYQDGDKENARNQLSKALEELNVDKGTIGVEEEMRHTDYLLLKNAASDATIINVSNTILDPIRMIKDDLEIKYIKESAKLSDQLLERATEVIREGVSIYEVRLELAKTLIEGGADSAIIRGSKHNKKLVNGDILDFEPVPRVHGYGAEVARTFFVGEATKSEKIIWDANMYSFDKTLDVIQPGVTMHEIDMTFRKSFMEGMNELQPNYISTRKVGHGMGLPGGHEKPFVQQGNMTKAVPGMVFVIDAGPGTNQHVMKLDYGYGARGYGVPIHIISTLLLTDDGFERLDKFTNEMIVL
jgi:Xaa-Pro dipeptidase